MKGIFLTLVFCLSLGCSTLQIHNQGKPRTPEYSEWHQGGGLRLVEISQPVNMTSRCEGKTWNTIKTRRSPLQAVLAWLTLGLYDPWEISYSCN